MHYGILVLDIGNGFLLLITYILRQYKHAEKIVSTTLNTLTHWLLSNICILRRQLPTANVIFGSKVTGRQIFQFTNFSIENVLTLGSFALKFMLRFRMFSLKIFCFQKSMTAGVFLILNNLYTVFINKYEVTRYATYRALRVYFKFQRHSKWKSLCNGHHASMDVIWVIGGLLCY